MSVRGAFFGNALKLAAVGLPGALLGLLSPFALGQAAPAAEGKGGFSPMLTSYCTKCHNADDWAGGLAFDTVDVGHAGEDPQIWEKAITKLRGRLMPPAGQKQPEQSEIDAL